MAIVNGYATLVEVKAAARITETAHDTRLEVVVESVSRLIDDHTGRHFFQSAASDRYFTPEWSDLLLIDDANSVTTLVVDEDGDRTYETTWAATDYDLKPYGQLLRGTSWPYTSIEVPPQGQRAFPRGLQKSVKITGVWGWPAVPKPVHQACLLQCERIFKRHDAPFGITGAAEFGQAIQIAKLDPDVALLLHAYVKTDARAA